MQFISPLSWPGGKSKNIKKILKYFPQKIENYVEPFLGGGSVALRLIYEERIINNVILSDINEDLIRFWKGVKDNQVIDEYPIVNTEKEAREIYNSIPKKNKKPWQSLFINRLSYSGIERAGFSKTRWEWKYYNCLKRVEVCQKLLQNTKILNADYKQIIQKYDQENVLFYFDPPYQNASKNIYVYEDFDYEELACILKKIKGKFILSINNSEYIKNLFSEFFIYEEQWKWSMTNGRHKQGAKIGKELVVTNFQPNLNGSFL